jgi:hypothetical protein
MKRLEIVRLRMGTVLPDGLIDEIRKLLLQNKYDNNITDNNITVYQRDGLNSDLSVHLSHPADNKELPGSLGTLMAYTLREHGMVDHTVWLEEPIAAKEESK